MTKRSVVDKAARVEAEALGGPAVLTSLLNGNGHQTQAAAAAASERAAATTTTITATTATATTVIAGGGGWLSGSQLKAFEEQVQTRCVCVCVLYLCSRIFCLCLLSCVWACALLCAVRHGVNCCVCCAKGVGCVRGSVAFFLGLVSRYDLGASRSSGNQSV